MKKILIVLVLGIMVLTGCENNLMNTPTKRVETLLNNYVTLDKGVLDDLDETLLSETVMTSDQKDKYRNILKKQYQNLSYEIKDETIDGDNATVEVEIEVYDYKKIIDDAETYLNDNQKEFLSEDEKTTDITKFNDYKLKQLEDAKDKVTYTLNLTLKKIDNKWVLDDLTDTEISVTTFYCPIENIDLRPSSAFRFSFSGNTTVPSTNIHFYFFDYMSFYPKGTTDSDIASAIQQQTNEITQQQQETNKQLGDLNDNLTNSDTSDASSSANEFFSGFESDDFGLSSIITAPLNLIKSITSSTCTPIGFKAPFVDQQITLPCMGNIYKKYFGSFSTLYQTITFGIVAYWVSVNIFFMVKGFKDPDSDRIEVLDL